MVNVFNLILKTTRIIKTFFTQKKKVAIGYRYQTIITYKRTKRSSSKPGRLLYWFC